MMHGPLNVKYVLATCVTNSGRHSSVHTEILSSYGLCTVLDVKATGNMMHNMLHAQRGCPNSRLIDGVASER